MHAYPMPGPAHDWADFGILEARIKTAPAGASTPNRSLTDSPLHGRERLMGKLYSIIPTVNIAPSQFVTKYPSEVHRGLRV